MNFQDFNNFIKHKREKIDSPRKKTARKTKIKKEKKYNELKIKKIKKLDREEMF